MDEGVGLVKTSVSSSYGLVSVVMAAKNVDRYLRAAIDSVLAQDNGWWELLVVDDHSVDKTAEITKSYAARDPRIIHLPMNANATGLVAVRNYGIRKARGRYIAFLDGDDVWEARKLSVQLRAMESQGAALCCCGYRKMYDDGTVGGGVVQVPESISYSELLKSNVIGASTAIFDTNAVGKVIMPEIATESDYYFEDYARWLRIAGKLASGKGALIGVNEPLVIYRVRRGSISQYKWRAARYTWRVYRRIERVPLHSAVYHFCHYVLRGLGKYLIQ